MKSRTRWSCAADRPEPFLWGCLWKHALRRATVSPSPYNRALEFRGVTLGCEKPRAFDHSFVMEHQLRSCCFASVQIGAETITQGVPVKAEAKLAYRLHVVGIAPDSHLGGDEGDVIGSLAVQRGGAVQVCAGLATAAYLRQHNGKGVLRAGEIVPGTAWVVEMLEVTNSHVSDASKPAVRGLHAVGRTEFKCLRSFRNLHRAFSFPGFLPQRFCTMLAVSYKPSCISLLMLREIAGGRMAGKLEGKIALVTDCSSGIGLAFPASDDSSYIAGVELFVDGGTVQV
jgi:hypothetical protein